MKHDAVMLMGRIHDLTQKWLRGELAAAGLSGIVPSHGDVLALLFMKGEATMHELAAFAHRTKPTTTVLVDKLEEMGLVRFCYPPAERKALKQAALDNDVSVSALIRLWLEQYQAEKKKDV